MPTIEQILETPDRFRVTWVEPWEARGAAGEEEVADITLSASILDCVAMQRHRYHQEGVELPDYQLLSDFLAVNGAWIDP